MSVQTYGDITPRTAAKAAAEFLKRGMARKVTEQFGTPYVLGRNETDSVKFRRYLALPAVTTALTEGVTPVGSKITYEDFNVSLVEYADFVKPSKKSLDLHEDKFIPEFSSILGEQAAETVELHRLGVLKAGTNVFRTGGVATRALVATKYDGGDQEKVSRAFGRQKAKPITEINTGSPKVGTRPVESGFFTVSHVDTEKDIRALTDFTPVAEYGTGMGLMHELGANTNMRYILSDMLEPWLASGVAVGATGLIAADATNIDVYPYLHFAKDSFQTVLLSGANALTVRVKMPEVSDSDPVGQRGILSWHTYTATVITNELWMARTEAGATELA